MKVSGSGRRETACRRVGELESEPAPEFFLPEHITAPFRSCKSKKQLVLLFADLLTIPLAGQCFLHALLFARFQVKRVALDFLDNVFGLHLALKAPQGILKGFAFLNSNLCQEKYTSKPS